jgi:hypothetical protein
MRVSNLSSQVERNLKMAFSALNFLGKNPWSLSMLGKTVFSKHTMSWIMSFPYLRASTVYPVVVQPSQW